jgi:exodeoxyribonuclease V gamma subunit
LSHPSRFFARDCLGLRVPDEEPAPEDVEPIELNALERHRLAARLAEAHFAGADLASQFHAVAATGALPHGYAGESEFHDAATRVLTIAHDAALHAPGGVRAPLSVVATAGGCRISATLSVVKDTAVLHLRPAALRARDLLRSWLSHLVLCVTGPHEVPRRTVLVGMDKAFAFDALTAAAAQALLESLVALRARATSEPLPLFPESSLAYAEYGLNLDGSKRTDPLKIARERWAGSDFKAGKSEREGAWNALVWRGVADPLGEDFQRLALAVFEPLLRNRVPLSVGPR